MAKARTMREWRILRGERQRDAAAAVGIHPVTWSEYERGRMVPSATILRRIARHYDCSCDDVLLPGDPLPFEAHYPRESRA